MLGFDAFGAHPPGEEPGGETRVPVRNGEQANFAFTGTAYSPTTDFSWGSAPVSFTGTGAATLDFAPAAAATHNAPTVTAVTGTGTVTLPVTADGAAVHGVRGTGAATLDLADTASAAHGIAGTEAATLSFSVSATGMHGVVGAGSTTLTLAPAAVAVHQRYEVHGIVKQGGILVNRRVRVYLRSSGALIAEADTVAGGFAIHTGFAAAEHFIVPIHLDDAATDWVPPVANRVLSVLAQDA